MKLISCITLMLTVFLTFFFNTLVEAAYDYTADGLIIDNVKIRKIGNCEHPYTISWKIDIENTTHQDKYLNLKFNLFDKDRFFLEEENINSFTIPQSTKITTSFTKHIAHDTFEKMCNIVFFNNKTQITEPIIITNSASLSYKEELEQTKQELKQTLERYYQTLAQYKQKFEQTYQELEQTKNENIKLEKELIKLENEIIWDDPVVPPPGFVLEEPNKKQKEQNISLRNLFMFIGIIAFILSIIWAVYGFTRKPSEKTTLSTKKSTTAYEKRTVEYEEGYQLINGVKASKPQIALSNMLNEHLGLAFDKQHNIKVGYRYPDMIYDFCGDKIAVEYDGDHYHKGKENRRDAELIKHGYKILHLISDGYITEKEFTIGLYKLIMSNKKVLYYDCIQKRTI